MNRFNVGTVTELLKDGYMKIKADGDEGDTMCFHQDSPYLFPVGFTEANGLLLEPPNGMCLLPERTYFLHLDSSRIQTFSTPSVH